ncbi:MAG: alkene reductase [Saprospiraceae bacterium]
MAKQLFSPYTLGSVELKNRVVMAPMTRSRAIDNVPNDLMTEYYANRAGAGLIITEGTAPAPGALGYPRIPGAFSPAQTKGWKEITDAVHAGGGLIYLQLMHTGRVTHPANLPGGSGRILAPSAVGLTKTKMYVDGEGELPMPVPEEANHDDIALLIEGYVESAKLAVRAGFDGVELHAANGYLIEQFLNANSNRRTDEYGGSVENRLRFALEVAKAVSVAVGKERTGMRVSPYGVFNEIKWGDETEETFVKLAEKLSEIGLAYLHLVDHEAMGAPEVPTGIKRKIRAAFNGTLILSGGYDAERAEKDLEAGHGDLVAFGRPFIANPDLVKRMKDGLELAEPDQDTFYTPGKEGYTTYPTYQEAH